MKGEFDMTIAGKTLCVSLLLIIAKLMGTVGNIREETAAVGGSLVLTCPNKSEVTLVTWKINPKTGGHCILGYRPDLSQSNRTNCTDNITWKSGPEHDPALQIRPVERASEGNYTCETAAGDGNFHITYHLTVLVPPKVAVYCDSRGNPVCQAAAGKPPAWISWVPGSSSSPEQEGLGDGTVTVRSTFMGNGSDEKNVICLVSHPAMNHSQSIACSSENLILYSSIVAILSILIFVALIYCSMLHGGRLCRKSKPETPPTHPLQDNMEDMEVEPYTTYVHKENVIYNSVSDLTVEQNLPRGLIPVT